MNKQKGITLIALVITIIVLLILAGVSIATLTGENGVLKKASTAGEETKKAEYKEILELIGNGLRPEKVLENLSAEEFIKRYQKAIEDEIEKGETLKGAKVATKDSTILRLMTKEGYIYEITENKVELLGKQEENEEIDLEDPNEATVNFSATTVDIETEIIATVTQSDNGASGINITRCKWIYTESDTPLGKDESKYTGESFKENPEELKTVITSAGTYYLHILTVDNAGNKIETVKGPITVIKTPAKVGEIVTGENKEYTNNGTAIIPVGFAIKPGCDDIENGLVISDVANDVNDTGNQFVWIPVENISDFVENYSYPITDSLVNDRSGTVYSRTGALPNGMTDEALTVEAAKGFYVARYETGQGLVSKKGIAVWRGIYQADAINSCLSFINNGYVKSALISGKQWDSVMRFVNGKQDGTGSIFNVTSANTARHTNATWPGATGMNSSDLVCNIYDLEGNGVEMTASYVYKYWPPSNQYKNFPVMRAGDTSSKQPAAERNYGNDYAGLTVVCRMVLFVIV